MADSPVISEVLSQHVDELAMLWSTRQALVASGYIGLAELVRIDGRIAAHEDGAAVGGEAAIEILKNRVAEPETERAFALAAVALNLHDRVAFAYAVSAVPPEGSGACGVAFALGWAPDEHLADVARDLLASTAAPRRWLGLAACRLHRVDPRAALLRGLEDRDARMRGEALRTAGEIGRSELVSRCVAAVEDEVADCRFWAARSAVLLGDRNKGLHALMGIGIVRGLRRDLAFRLSIQALDVGAAHLLLQVLRKDPLAPRWLIQGSGIAGDPVYVSWLIGHMANEKTARLAGEAFSLITGVNLERSGLEGKQPENFEPGPNDDPDDLNVEIDPDDGLPWPDVAKIEKWWDANSSRFQKGTRYFMGAPVTREHCIDVLKNGYQRQRILAAHYLCLLDPGTPLFNTSAPAWRQQRLLAKMT
jgi:uncharacterized protein (TIGR02270 family)